jgi:hypothetical protein
MKLRRFGPSEHMVPVIGQGTWHTESTPPRTPGRGICGSPGKSSPASTTPFRGLQATRAAGAIAGCDRRPMPKAAILAVSGDEQELQVLARS